LGSEAARLEEEIWAVTRESGGLGGEKAVRRGAKRARDRM
jgi:hypothetical protein